MTFWHHVYSVEEMQAYYLAKLPAIREAARECGYAIGLHGSTRRDLDLIAIPWVETATDKDALARAIHKAASGGFTQEKYEWEAKPNGRMAASFPICWTEWSDMVSAGHVDLSVMVAPPEIGGEATDDWGAKDREEAKKFADRFIEIVNEDHTDVISFNRDWGCLLRNHIEDLRRALAKAPQAAAPEVKGEMESTWVPVYVDRAICDLIPGEGYAREIARSAWDWDDRHPGYENTLYRWQNEAIRQRRDLIALQEQFAMEYESLRSKKEVEG
jgi:hypothetical protein